MGSKGETCLVLSYDRVYDVIQQCDASAPLQPSLAINWHNLDLLYMANQTQELKALLDARDIRLFVDSTNKTARLSIFGGELTLDSHLAYFACSTLRDIATAKNDVLWEIYGDIISTDPVNTSRTLSNIRKALCHRQLGSSHLKLPPCFCYTCFQKMRRSLNTSSLRKRYNLKHHIYTSFPPTHRNAHRRVSPLFRNGFPSW